ncbi:MAG TPA: phosphoesterase [Methanocorpusculum sp.]|nr:phosphoesterase [Methanocorpusculum sp.]
MPSILRRKKSNNKIPIKEKIVKRTSGIVHLTHNDLDAAGSDAFCRMKYGEDVLTFFSSVGRYPWFLSQIASCAGKGDTLFITDLSYNKSAEDAVRKISAAGWKIIWLDHHKWTDEEKKKTASYIDTLIVDTSKCAAGIAYSYFKPENEKAAEIAKVVCDYDLWKHEDPRSAVLGIITSGNKNLRLVRDKFTDGIIIDDEIEQIYKKIESDKNRCIKKSRKHTKIYEGRYKIAVMPAYGYPSETAAENRKFFGSDIELLVFDNGKFSVRSVPDISHLIAKEFGGGGHPNAAGGSFTFKTIDKIRFKLLGRIRCADKFIEAAEKL